MEPGTSGTDDFSELRSRVSAAWDMDLFHDAAGRVVSALEDHLRRVQSGAGPVLNWADPCDNIDVARRCLAAGSAVDADRVAALTQTVLSRGQSLHHPRYIGHQVPAPSPLAGLFDAVGAITNQVMGVYEMGPFTTAIEHVMVDTLGQEIGWASGQFAGVATHGGSLANLTALLTARNVALPGGWSAGIDSGQRVCVVANADAHYSIARALGIMGMGTDSLVAAPRGAARSLDARGLDQLLAELRRDERQVIAVVASACSTSVGAFDDLDSVADVCERHGVWLHVDAAHGGGALLSDRHRDRLHGIHRADSVVWDAHKMMFVPALCAFVFFRNPEHGLAAFHQDAPYLWDDDAPAARYDSALRTVECTKRAAALGLWGLWSVFGRELFGDLVELTFGLAERLFELLQAASDFVVMQRPQANIVVFRYTPDRPALSDGAANRLQSQLREQLVRSGQFYIVQTRIDGMIWLRVTVMNPLTTSADLRAMLDSIRDLGVANDAVTDFDEREP